MIAKACLRQGSFTLGNPGIATHRGEIRQRRAAVTFAMVAMVPMPPAFLQSASDFAAPGEGWDNEGSTRATAPFAVHPYRVRIPPSPFRPVAAQGIAGDFGFCTTLCTTLAQPLGHGNASGGRRRRPLKTIVLGLLALALVGCTSPQERARRALAMQAELDRASSRGIECCAWMPQL